MEEVQISVIPASWAELFQHTEPKQHSQNTKQYQVLA